VWRVYGSHPLALAASINFTGGEFFTGEETCETPLVTAAAEFEATDKETKRQTNKQTNKQTN